MMSQNDVFRRLSAFKFWITIRFAREECQGLAWLTDQSFTGIKFENPFLLSSAPPTESENNILRAFDAGWGGVVVKTIGLHPVVNVVGARTKFFRRRRTTTTSR